MKKFLFLLVVISSFSSCSNLWDDPIDPQKKARMDAYATVSNYHTLKQMVLIEYYALFSNNFENEMFELIPNGNQLRTFWDLTEALYTVEADLESALSTIDNMDEVSSANDLLLLKSVQSAKWDWLWKKVYWVGDRIEMRDKLTVFFNYASQKEKEEAFQTFVAGGRINGVANVSDFITKLDKGDFDTKAFNFDKDLETYHSSYSKWKEDNGVRRNIEAAYDIGKKGLEHGTKIITKSVEYALPPAGTAFDALDKVNKFCEYANKFLSDETAIQKVEKNINENYKSFTNNAANNSKSIVEQAEVISKTYTINKQPESAVVDYSNENWGGLNVIIKDQLSEISTVIAERSNELVDDIWPAIMIYTDLAKNELGEWTMAFPEGEWDITLLDDKGNINVQTETPILAGHFKELQYVADLGGDNPVADNDSENDGFNAATSFPQFSVFSIGFGLGYADVLEGSGFHSVTGDIGSMGYSSDTNTPVIWNNNKFTIDVSESWANIGGTNGSIITQGQGEIIEDDQGQLYCNFTIAAEKSYYYASDGVLKDHKKWTITVEHLPYYGKSGSWDVFGISSNQNSSLINDIPNFITNFNYYMKWNNSTSGGESYSEVQVDKKEDISIVESFAKLFILFRDE
ncbi:MAG TPA: hypothetical protein VJ951_05660 [Bacteroidales bacterium]|nr:hypothetical protein [Bacteroidales bacterium]